MSEKVRLVVLFGGQSAEHDVSCVTARHVIDAVDLDRYDVVPIGISRDGTWALSESTLRMLEPGPEGSPSAGLDSVDKLDPTGTALQPSGAVTSADPTVNVVVLPLLHGPNGEDGTVQGLLQLAGVPYVGCNVLSSALSMDKIKAKEMLAFHGISQARWHTLSSQHPGPYAEADLDAIAEDLGYPMFVKPANMGSSIGVSRVETMTEFVKAVELALSYDEWVLVEEGINGREIEVAVLGNQNPKVSVPGEIKPGDTWYSYEDKYFDGVAEARIPAALTGDVVDRINEVAKATFRALRCEGMARVDFFYEADGRGLLINEVNTIPGFTPISMYPKLWEASGLGYSELIDELIRLALERHERRSKLR